MVNNYDIEKNERMMPEGWPFWLFDDVLALFMSSLKKKMSIQVFCPFFNQIVCWFAFDIEMYEFFQYFGY